MAPEVGSKQYKRFLSFEETATDNQVMINRLQLAREFLIEALKLTW